MSNIVESITDAKWAGPEQSQHKSMFSHTKHHVHFFFKHFSKRAKLKPLAGRFWSTGLMFDTPGLESF